MTNPNLPSDDNLRAMLAATERGLWVCWIYPVHGANRTVKVWNRSLEVPPLDRGYYPVGCIAYER